MTDRIRRRIAIHRRSWSITGPLFAVLYIVALALGVVGVNPGKGWAAAPLWQPQPDWGIEYESRATDGGYGNAINGGVNGWEPVISGNGRYVVYVSRATNMVPGGDANGHSSDAVLHDRLTGQNEYAGVDSNGRQFGSDNYASQISYDGRYVLLYQGGALFLRDRQAGVTQRVGSGFYPSMSSDARYIAFTTESDGLIPGGRMGDSYDVVVLDRTTGQHDLISQRADGSRFSSFSYNGEEFTPSISGDGRYVVFFTPGNDPSSGDTNGQFDVYVRDRVAGTTTWVSNDAPAGYYGCLDPTIAILGRYVAYRCEYTAPDNSFHSDVFVSDLVTGETTLASIDATQTSYPSISSDGRYVGFGTGSGHVEVYDRQTGQTALLTQNLSTYGYHVNFSANGQWAAFDADALSKGGAVYVRPLPFNTADATYTESSAPATPTGFTATSPTRTPALTWNPVSGADHYNVYRDGGAAAVGSPVATAFTDTSSLADGDHTYTVTAINTQGTESLRSVPITVTVDTTAPVVSALSWTSNPLAEGQSTQLSATVTDNLSGVSRVSLAVDGAPPQPLTYDPTSGTWQVTFGANLIVNTYNISVIATDSAANASTPMIDVLAVYNAANGYVTGHEWLQPSADDTMPIAGDSATHNPAKMVVGFTNVKAATSTTPTTGSFEVHYVVKQNQHEFSLSSTSVDWLVVPDSTHASILGHADLTTYVNGVPTLTHNVAVRFDVVLGTNGSTDHVTMRIFGPGVDPATGTPSWIVSDDAIPHISHVMIKQ